jgi:hypothetical protein
MRQELVRVREATDVLPAMDARMAHVEEPQARRSIARPDLVAEQLDAHPLGPRPPPQLGRAQPDPILVRPPLPVPVSAAGSACATSSTDSAPSHSRSSSARSTSRPNSCSFSRSCSSLSLAASEAWASRSSLAIVLSQPARLPMREGSQCGFKTRLHQSIAQSPGFRSRRAVVDPA